MTKSLLADTVNSKNIIYSDLGFSNMYHTEESTTYNLDLNESHVWSASQALCRMAIGKTKELQQFADSKICDSSEDERDSDCTKFDTIKNLIRPGKIFKMT